ncbi:MAG: 23S rRNA (adenine(1618)-N(6))-methyltransferase RlmF [Algibacter sp.]|uniref:23S rRNA (adenine(1618)-N(6))-methyltransferase RlmF n=1 Tax=Algibacter sp. TaxID=1872428 RepID=UPI0026132549|nr:23S rRNA (adenine(1618)-N(6))-methyltransferase RlmF [Algibacter sp.]MDG1729768.1 23S rRNA (adenine(1618)-N(6))-methyltransferase RlmF [Algibacter sp.]MDG2177922.1 23S rRNA (adenine(1618)-N(6))-methyltransferase RlmF [Algibacter sp.]
MSNSKLHPKNKHKSGYNLDALCEIYPGLLSFVFENKYETKTIDFANPKAVKALNTALLFKHYNISFWEFPDTHLCPPIPGRVDYIHHIAEVLKLSKISGKINVLDIGTGASCIYPLLGHAEYQWNFVATDIDETSLKHAEKIIDKNELDKVIELRLQKDSLQIFKGVLNEHDRFSVSICNPPFYKSETDALEATMQKLKGLNREDAKVVRNFSGTQNELWYKGGEKAFIHNYLYESALFKTQCVWFTTLVSKKDLVKGMYASLKKLGATDIKTITMGQGNKVSRIVAWTFK